MDLRTHPAGRTAGRREKRTWRLFSICWENSRFWSMGKVSWVYEHSICPVAVLTVFPPRQSRVGTLAFQCCMNLLQVQVFTILIVDWALTDICQTHGQWFWFYFLWLCGRMNKAWMALTLTGKTWDSYRLEQEFGVYIKNICYNYGIEVCIKRGSLQKKCRGKLVLWICTVLLSFWLCLGSDVQTYLSCGTCWLV